MTTFKLHRTVFMVCEEGLEIDEINDEDIANLKGSNFRFV